MRKVAFVISLLLASAASAGPVRVDGGLLEGTAEDGLMVYRGIPFAAPPVGRLRWRAPQPAAKWQGVRKADTFGPACMSAEGLKVLDDYFAWRRR
jgi:para-nitrobenzyl esterase